jgi:uncharacterized peroxidase-related enzyme
VPNVFLALARRPAEWRAFFAYHDARCSRRIPGLTKGEREMIVVAVSGRNRCIYCVVAARRHPAHLREKAARGRPVATNHLKADITPRQKAMCDFAVKVTEAHRTSRRRGLRRAQAARLHRRGHLGHRRHRSLLRPIQPHGQH